MELVLRLLAIANLPAGAIGAAAGLSQAYGRIFAEAQAPLPFAAAGGAVAKRENDPAAWKNTGHQSTTQGVMQFEDSDGGGLEVLKYGRTEGRRFLHWAHSGRKNAAPTLYL